MCAPLSNHAGPGKEATSTLWVLVHRLPEKEDQMRWKQAILSFVCRARGAMRVSVVGARVRKGL